MGGRPTAGPVTPQLRVEILKELQALIDSREARDRLDRSPLAEAKGKDHWVLHLLLRAQESSQTHTDLLVGTAYSNLLARLQSVEDALQRSKEFDAGLDAEVRARFDALENSVGTKITEGIDGGVAKITTALGATVTENLDQKWKPVGDSIETFAQGSRQVLKDVADTYRVATQTRLLLNENARRITDLGRDLVALEDSLKLVVAKTLEEGLQPLDQRLSAIEAHLGIQPANHTARAPAEKPASDA